MKHKDFYTGLDPFLKERFAVEIFKDGEYFVDLHNLCNLELAEYENKNLNLTFKFAFQHEFIPAKFGVGSIFILEFHDANISGMDIRGGLTDLGTFEGIQVINEDLDQQTLEAIIWFGDVQMRITTGHISFICNVIPPKKLKAPGTLSGEILKRLLK